MIKKIRKPNIAKSLVDNSISALISAIEIHNKPSFSYRYETTVILIINAWELLLKGYIYKYRLKKKLYEIDEEGTKNYLTFLKSLSNVRTYLGKDYFSLFDNLKELYLYRCTYIHYYGDKIKCNQLVFSLIHKNIQFYLKFVGEFFPKSKLIDDDFIILPIGFKRIIDPISIIKECISGNNQNDSEEFKKFVKSIIDTSETLFKEGIEEGIMTEYNLKLINRKSTKNFDFTVKKSDHGIPIKEEKIIKVTNDLDAEKVQISDEEFKQLYPYTYRELKKKVRETYGKDHKNIFDEINKTEVKPNPNYYNNRKLNPNKENGVSQGFYSPRCIEEVFKKHFQIHTS